MHMPRKDPSFSGGDIVRLWCHNLNENEQNEILLFFLLIVPGILLTDFQTRAILLKIERVVPGRLMKLLVRFFIRYTAQLRLIINSLWAEIVFENELTRKEVIRCIEKRVMEL
jgi:hypothetical protein